MRMRIKNQIIFFTVLFMFCLLFLNMRVKAEEVNDYNIEEIGVTVTIPSNFMIYTENDVELPEGIYLYMNDPEMGCNVFIQKIDSPWRNYDRWNDEELLANIIPDKEVQKEEGVLIDQAEIYHNFQTRFLIFQRTDEEDQEKELVGLTWHEFKVISIIMQIDGDITEEHYKILKEIIDNMKIEEDSEGDIQESETVDQEEEKLYIDEETGVFFIIPEGWKKSELSKAEKLDLKLVKEKENPLELNLILFGAEDLWEQETEEVKRHYSRNLYTMWMEDKIKQDLKESMESIDIEVSDKDIMTKTYGNNICFIIESKNLNSEAAMNVTVAACIKNGILCHFQLMGSNTQDELEDLESILSSMKFPEFDYEIVENDTEPEIDEYFNTDGGYRPNYTNTYNSKNIVGYKFFGFVFLALYYMPILYYRIVKNGRSVERKKAIKISLLYGIFIGIFLIFIMFYICNGLYMNPSSVFSSIPIFYWILRSGARKEKQQSINKIDYTSEINSEEESSIVKKDNLNSMPSENIHALPPDTILQEKYMIESILGNGGFGITYKGIDLLMGVHIAMMWYKKS